MKIRKIACPIVDGLLGILEMTGTTDFSTHSRPSFTKHQALWSSSLRKPEPKLLWGWKFRVKMKLWWCLALLFFTLVISVVNDYFIGQ